MTTTATGDRRGGRLTWGAEAALCCGILAPLLSVAVDLVAGALWHGYSFTTRSAGELTAVGAPTRAYTLPLLLASDLLLIIFGLGAHRVADHNRALRTSADLLIAFAALSLITTAAFPAHTGRTTTPPGAGVIISAAALLCVIAAIAVGAIAYRGRFRVYSVTTLLAFAVLTVLGLTVQSTPHIGLQERTNGYLYLLWVLVLAAVLLRSEARNVGRYQKERQS